MHVRANFDLMIRVVKNELTVEPVWLYLYTSFAVVESRTPLQFRVLYLYVQEPSFSCIVHAIH